MKRSPRPQDISWFLDHYERGQLNLDPPYQRRSVWSLSDRRFFVDTIMNDFPAPPVFLHKTLDESGRATYHVVDGKQRLQTIIDFTRNIIRLPDDFSDVNLQRKRWSDLSPEDKSRFWNYEIVVEMLPDVTGTAVKDIFDRINRNSRKLTPQELRHAKYDGWFSKAAEAEAEKEEWKRFGVVTAARAKRMADVQFISELMAITIKGALQGFDQDALDDLYADYDDLEAQPTFVEEDFRESFEEVKEYLRDLLEIDPQLLAYLKIQAHLYTLWGYLTLEASRRLPPAALAPLYGQFLARVATRLELPISEATTATNPDTYQLAEISYAANTRGANTDLTPRQARHAALITALHGTEAQIDEGQ